jgi:hypothetical protein
MRPFLSEAAVTSSNNHFWERRISPCLASSINQRLA